MTDVITAVWIDEHDAFLVCDKDDASVAQGSRAARIEAFEMPYIRVHKHDGNVVEFPRHDIQGVEIQRVEDD